MSKRTRLRKLLLQILLGATLVLVGPLDASRESGPSVTERRTVFVLVDESGTLQSDREGWRKEAAALLAHTLPRGSALALSGFGNPERQLDLSLARLDDDEAGLRERRRVAMISAALKNADQFTDLYGAIRQVMQKVESIDKEVLRAAPPALLLLTDFVPDPKPDRAVIEATCKSIRDSGIELVAIGFGNVDKSTQELLTGCAGTVPTPTLSDASQLVETFWKISRRLSRSIRTHEIRLQEQKPTTIQFPDWGEGAVLVGFSPTKSASSWTWTVEGSDAGPHFRAARVKVPKSRTLSVTVSGATDLRLSVAVRGDVLLSVQSPVAQPWLLGEAVPVESRLLSASTGEPASEWIRFAAVDHAAWVKMETQQEVPMRLEPGTATFHAPLLISSAKASELHSRVLIDGTPWTGDATATIERLPFRTSDAESKLVTWAWWPGLETDVTLRTSLGDREFTLECGPSQNLGGQLQKLAFGPTATSANLRFTAGQTTPPVWANWLAPLPSITGSLRLKTSFAKGQTVSSNEIPIVVTFIPLWLRISITILPIALFVVLLRGRTLPDWHLIPIDSEGRTQRSEVIALKRYRRSLDLSPYGLPNSEISRNVSGRTWIVLGAEVTLRIGGQLRYNGERKALQVGDVISHRRSSVDVVGFRVEKL